MTAIGNASVSLHPKSPLPLTCDAAQRRTRSKRRRRTWPLQGRAEREFMRALEGVARHVGHIIDGLSDAASLPSLTQVLRAYSDALEPWARAAAKRMIGEVNESNLRMWQSLSDEMSRELARDLRTAPVREIMAALEAEQVELIKSLPTEAATRVHELTLKGLEDSRRASDYYAEIMRSGEVTQSRAVLIARTETARTASALTEARSMAAGATHYRWRTVGDADVRPGHKAMEGKICAWADPPAVNENGRIMHHHPGRIWNCRCFAEPIIDT